MLPSCRYFYYRKQDVKPLSIIKANAASYFDVAVLRCLFQPQWAEEGVYWALTYCLQRLRRALDAKAGRGEAGLLPPRPRPRSHSVAAMPYLGADGRKSKARIYIGNLRFDQFNMLLPWYCASYFSFRAVCADVIL